jgi:hypothetical protein
VQGAVPGSGAEGNPMTKMLGLSLAMLLLGGSAALARTPSERSQSPVPAFNVEATCRSVSNDTRLNYESCLTEERTALGQLKQSWTSFSADSRGECLTLTTGSTLPSYVTLQDCLQTSRDAKNLLKKDPVGGLSRP